MNEDLMWRLNLIEKSEFLTAWELKFMALANFFQASTLMKAGFFICGVGTIRDSRKLKNLIVMAESGILETFFLI